MFAAEPKARGNVWPRRTGACVAVPEHTQRQTYRHPWFHLLHHLDLPKDCSHPILPVLPPKISQTPVSIPTIAAIVLVFIWTTASGCPPIFPPVQLESFQHLLQPWPLSWPSPCGHSGYSCHQQNFIQTYFMPLYLCIYCSFSLEQPCLFYLLFLNPSQILHLSTPPATQSKIPSVQSLYTFKWPLHCTCYARL